MNSRTTTSESLGLLLATWAVCALVVTSVAAVGGLTGHLGLAVATILFLATFCCCLVVADRILPAASPTLDAVDGHRIQ